MYGKRDEPYAVLSRPGSQLETSIAPKAVLAAIVTVDDLELLEALEDRIDLAAARKALKAPGSQSLKDVRAALGV